MKRGYKRGPEYDAYMKEAIERFKVRTTVGNAVHEQNELEPETVDENTKESIIEALIKVTADVKRILSEYGFDIDEISITDDGNWLQIKLPEFIYLNGSTLSLSVLKYFDWEYEEILELDLRMECICIADEIETILIPASVRDIYMEKTDFEKLCDTKIKEDIKKRKESISKKFKFICNGEPKNPILQKWIQLTLNKRFREIDPIIGKDLRHKYW